MLNKFKTNLIQFRTRTSTQHQHAINNTNAFNALTFQHCIVIIHNNNYHFYHLSQSLHYLEIIFSSLVDAHVLRIQMLHVLKYWFNNLNSTNFLTWQTLRISIVILQIQVEKHLIGFRIKESFYLEVNHYSNILS